MEAAAIADLQELPALALAVSFAASRVNLLNEHSDGSIADKLSRVRKLRRILLKSADACAEAGVVPTDPVEAIKRGTGHIDNWFGRSCARRAARWGARHSSFTKSP
jgi:hypothetical protein